MIRFHLLTKKLEVENDWFETIVFFYARCRCWRSNCGDRNAFGEAFFLLIRKQLFWVGFYVFLLVFPMVVAYSCKRGKTKVETIVQRQKCNFSMATAKSHFLPKILVISLMPSPEEAMCILRFPLFFLLLSIKLQRGQTGLESCLKVPREVTLQRMLIFNLTFFFHLTTTTFWQVLQVLEKKWKWKNTQYTRWQRAVKAFYFLCMDVDKMW